MRALLALAATLLVPITAAGAQPQGAERSTPAGVQAERPDFDENRLGRLLRAMGEPVLTGSGDSGPWHRRFRVVVESDRGGPALRVDFLSDGTAAARETVVHRARRRGRYSIERQQVRRLEPDVARAVAEAIGESGLADLPSFVPLADAPPDGPKKGSRGRSACRSLSCCWSWSSRAETGSSGGAAAK